MEDGLQKLIYEHVFTLYRRQSLLVNFNKRTTVKILQCILRISQIKVFKRFCIVVIRDPAAFRRKH